MLSIFFLLISFFASLNLFSLDDSSDSDTEITEIIEDCEETKQHKLPPNVCQEVEENLLEAFNEENLNLNFLEANILCIGTGRSEKLNLIHPKPTIIREQDYSIDTKRNIGADFCVNAFSVSKILTLQLKNLGAVFFAHVGLIGLTKKLNKKLLSAYGKMLQEHGWFIFTSEVVFEAALKQHLSKNSEKDIQNFLDELSKNLLKAGFSSVRAKLKLEPSFGKKCVSILLVGKKK